MKSLSDLLANKDKVQKELTKHPRFKAIDEIYQRINRDRVVVEGKKPWTKQLIGIKISHLSPSDLDYFLKRIQQSPNPARAFWGMLKVKNSLQTPLL